jgi:FAD/FMN-containing dehydrogenase
MEIFDSLSQSLGADVIFRGSDPALARHLRDFSYHTPESVVPAAIALPRTVEQVSAILRICHERRQPITAQGGLTGLVGGAVPAGGEVALSLERLRAIVEVDPQAATMTVEAGAPLQVVQEAAERAELFFPLDLGARGSCSIGGNAATNAGGNRVLRYGMMRELVLGLEVVLADGTVMSSLNKMLKNNAGYDLKHLFLGSEGTLGIITKLVVRLFPKPRSACTAFCSLGGYDAAMSLLAQARAKLAGTLSAFEVMWPSCYELATQVVTQAPLAQGRALYVLLDVLGSDQKADQARFESFMEDALNDGVINDAVIAQSQKESLALWAVRDSVAEFPRLMGSSVGFDVSVPTGAMAAFIEACEKRLRERAADSRTLWFGHVADGNLHLLCTALDAAAKQTVEMAVYETVRDWRGSVSAEHGIGLAKKPYLAFSRSDAELKLMHTLKAALDPRGILNPGKILSEA